jgi:hypothetical protein
LDEDDCQPVNLWFSVVATMRRTRENRLTGNAGDGASAELPPETDDAELPAEACLF